jgi:hypothetical protein
VSDCAGMDHPLKQCVLEPPNAQDQKRAKTSVKKQTYAPDFCILMLGALASQSAFNLSTHRLEIISINSSCDPGYFMDGYSGISTPARRSIS